MNSVIISIVFVWLWTFPPNSSSRYRWPDDSHLLSVCVVSMMMVILNHNLENRMRFKVVFSRVGMAFRDFAIVLISFVLYFPFFLPMQWVYNNINNCSGGFYPQDCLNLVWDTSNRLLFSIGFCYYFIYESRWWDKWERKKDTFQNICKKYEVLPGSLTLLDLLRRSLEYPWLQN
eukprot:UN29369